MVSALAPPKAVVISVGALARGGRRLPGAPGKTGPPRPAPALVGGGVVGSLVVVVGSVVVVGGVVAVWCVWCAASGSCPVVPPLRFRLRPGRRSGLWGGPSAFRPAVRVGPGKPPVTRRRKPETNDAEKCRILSNPGICCKMVS